MINIKLSSVIKRNVKRKIPLNYQCGFFDASVKNPFIITDELMKRMDILQEQYSHPSDLSRGIFTYLLNNIDYDFIHTQSKGYGTSKDVWESKKGICGEMSFLYTTLARYCGIKSECVDVQRDYTNKKVFHMCSQVNIHSPILVDVAYKQFNITHKKYTVMSDNDVLRCFSSWRK